MNDFQSIDSGKGLLKANYGQPAQDDTLSLALKKRREKLSETKGMNGVPNQDEQALLE